MARLTRLEAAILQSFFATRDNGPESFESMAANEHLMHVLDEEEGQDG